MNIKLNNGTTTAVAELDLDVKYISTVRVEVFSENSTGAHRAELMIDTAVPPDELPQEDDEDE